MSTQTLSSINRNDLIESASKKYLNGEIDLKGFEEIESDYSRIYLDALKKLLASRHDIEQEIMDEEKNTQTRIKKVQVLIVLLSILFILLLILSSQ